MNGLAATMVAAMLVSGTAHAEEKPRVLWFRADHPPISILSGPDQDKGAGDLRGQIFWRRMPDYDHRWVNAPALRIIEQLRALPNACAPTLMRTPEREAFLHFSDPVTTLLPNGLITTRRGLERFAQFRRDDGAIWLDKALAGGARVAVHPGRSYGAAIDAVLAGRANTPAVVPNAHSDTLLASLRKLTTRDDFDGVVGYAIELSYLTRTQGLDGGDLVYLAIAEAPPLGNAAFACAKGEVGERVIARVNALLNDPQVQREVTDSYRDWLPPDAAALYDGLRAAEAAKGSR
ncbi:MAG: TIGR02285 family protein [Alphaproteobacteria bacterium]|nr:TIGR02285 family protein [Alphaproteobacteria bacterium]MBF0391525.1 TIGR02285 family protein [Alphaproteobacteria bacterium]